MGDASKIEWTTATYNPWRGCDKVSPGCAHCYMFRDQERYGRDPSVVTRCSDGTFFAPVRSKKWRELPSGALVFTCSWSDWFHEDADPWRDEAWEVLRQRPDLTWQILTKRPERIADHLPAWWGDADCETPQNIWLGVSIENRRFVHRADLLREIPAAVRFISAEPLLGPLVTKPPKTEWDAEYAPEERWPDGYIGDPLDLTGIDWLIVGGESGPGHRPMKAEWVRDLRFAAQASGTAFFFKQWGGARPTSGGRLLEDRTWDEMPVVRS